MIRVSKVTGERRDVGGRGKSGPGNNVSIVRPLVKRLGRWTKNGLNALINGLWPKSADRPLPEPASVRRVLLIRANFRIGNIVLVTSLLPVIRARFPHASIDVLTGDVPASLLQGLEFDRVHVLSRNHVRMPWRFVALFASLRRRKFDVAIDGGMSSFSGALYGWLAGAAWRVGAAGRNDGFLNVRLSLSASSSVYDASREVARALEVPGVEAWPSYRVSANEAAEAEAYFGDQGRMGAFVALFVGGHGHKRWPWPLWLELVERLDREKIPTVVFVGPEELPFASVLQAHAWSSVRIVPPRSLRSFAALLARAGLLVTSDSGPMHLAAALRVHVTAIIQDERSMFYVPPDGNASVLLRPSSAEVASAIRAGFSLAPSRPPS